MTESSISFRRYALLHGWARWLARLPEIEDQKKQLIRLRGSNWGIAVKDDILALDYQRLDFFAHRALYAIDMFGVSGMSVWTDEGWYHASKEEIKADNRKMLSRYRNKSRRAKILLKQSGHLYCKTCDNRGFILEGDIDRECPDCHVEGIVNVDEGDSL